MILHVASHKVCHSGFDPENGQEMVDGAYRYGYPEEWIGKMREKG